MSAATRLIASLGDDVFADVQEELNADSFQDSLPPQLDESGAAKWFPTVRNAMGVIMGGSSKVKVIKVTPNSCTFKLRAQGFIMDHTSVVKLASMLRTVPNIELAVFMQNQRMYILCVERDGDEKPQA